MTFYTSLLRRRAAGLVVLLRGGGLPSHVWTAPRRSLFSASSSLLSSSSTASHTTDHTRPPSSTEGFTDPSAASSASIGGSKGTYRVLRLHHLPKNWLHEEVMEFIQHVAVAAGTSLTSSPDGAQGQEAELREDEGEGVRSHIHRLIFSFGRQTGVVFGTPRLVIAASSPLCDLLLHRLPPLEDDDYRCRIYFTEEETTEKHVWGLGSDESVGGSSSSHTSIVELIEESIEEEKAVALRQLELDRYLFAPDLLYDLQRLHQRRRLTSNEEVLLLSFMAADEEAFSQRFGKTAQKSGKRKLRRRVKDLAGVLGRGSMQNTPIPKPYVQGRHL